MMLIHRRLMVLGRVLRRVLGWRLLLIVGMGRLLRVLLVMRVMRLRWRP